MYPGKKATRKHIMLYYIHTYRVVESSHLSWYLVSVLKVGTTTWFGVLLAEFSGSGEIETNSRWGRKGRKAKE